MLLKRRNKDVPQVSKTDTNLQAFDTHFSPISPADGKQTADTQPLTAEAALIAELSTLVTAGSRFVPPAPGIDSGTWEPAQPVQVPVVAQDESPEAKRIIRFVGVCSASVTQREISGGTGLGLETVISLLPVLVQSGALRIVSGEQNLAQYRLAGFTPVPPAPPVPYIRPEVKWNNEQRARELAKDAVNRPKPMPRYKPSDSAVDAALREKATVRPLTDAERKELAASRDRLEINPNMFLR